MKLSISYAILLLFLNIVAKSQCLKVKDIPFKEGEKLVYTVKYNLGFLWFDAGEVIFLVDTIKNKKGKKFFHFVSTGRSYKSYDWIFKVRDKYEVITFEKNLRPIYFHRKTSEGGYNVENIFRFDYKNDKIYMKISHSDTLPYKDTINKIECLRDALSSAYLLRSLGLSNLEKGMKINLDMLLDGKKFNIYVKFIGKEVIEINDSTKVKTLKFTTKTIESSIFRSGENLFVWVTDDKNKIPIRVEAYILVGKVIVDLVSYEGLKYSTKSFILINENKRKKN